MKIGKRTLTLRRAIVLVVVAGLLAPATLISGYSWFKQYNDGIKRQTLTQRFGNVRHSTETVGACLMHPVHQLPGTKAARRVFTQIRAIRGEFSPTQS